MQRCHILPLYLPSLFFKKTYLANIWAPETTEPDPGNLAHLREAILHLEFCSKSEMLSSGSTAFSLKELTNWQYLFKTFILTLRSISYASRAAYQGAFRAQLFKTTPQAAIGCSRISGFRRPSWRGTFWPKQFQERARQVTQRREKVVHTVTLLLSLVTGPWVLWQQWSLREPGLVPIHLGIEKDQEAPWVGLENPQNGNEASCAHKGPSLAVASFDPWQLLNTLQRQTKLRQSKSMLVTRAPPGPQGCTPEWSGRVQKRHMIRSKGNQSKALQGRHFCPQLQPEHPRNSARSKSTLKWQPWVFRGNSTQANKEYCLPEQRQCRADQGLRVLLHCLD